MVVCVHIAEPDSFSAPHRLLGNDLYTKLGQVSLPGV
jgi:hypothetical protein